MTVAPERPTRPRRRRRDLVVIAVLAVVAAVLAVLLVLQSGEDSSAPTPGQPASVGVGTSGPPSEEAAVGDLARRTPGDPMALGRPDAPVSMIMFTDYRCPFCAKFSRDTEAELVRDYVDTGKVRLEWRDYPIFGDQSTAAAAAGRAAAAQGRFWEYNKAIFAEAPDRAHADLPDARLIEYASRVGVPDLARFERDMRSPEALAAVQADLDEASSLGVPSTPAFVVGGSPMLGAQPVEVFRQELDAALGGGR